MEIKLGEEKQIKEGCEVLKKLEEKINTDKIRQPLFKMVLTTLGTYAYQNKEGIWIVPVTTLKY